MINGQGQSFNPLNLRNVIPGVVMALVKDTNDPESLGRIKVEFPLLRPNTNALSEGEQMIESDWIRMASFFAGSGRGAFFMPQVGDEVLVSFILGDVNQPFVIGFLWNGQDRPSVAEVEKQQFVREIKTKGGKTITFDDTEEGSITITDQNQNQVVISTDSNKITLSSKGDIELLAPEGTLRMQAMNVSISSDTSTTLNTETAELTATGVMTLSGELVNINP